MKLLVVALLFAGLCSPRLQEAPQHAAIERLGDREAAAWVTGSRACFALRLAEPRETVRVISAVQEDLERIEGTNVWFGAFEIERIEEVVMGVRFVFVEEGRFENGPSLPTLRGPQAPPAPAEADPLLGAVTEHAVGGGGLGEPRSVWVYVPPEVRPERVEQVLLMTDGGAIERYAKIVEPLVTSGAIPPTAIVAADNGGSDPQVPGPPGDLRAHEYLPGYSEFVGLGDSERYDRHWTFFTEFLPAWAADSLGLAGQPILFGVSNGATFCATVAGRLPERFPTAILCSVAWENTADHFEPIDSAQALFLSGGTLEPRFLEETRAVHAAAVETGREARLVEAVGGHDSAVWKDQLAAGLLWLAGRERFGDR